MRTPVAIPVEAYLRKRYPVAFAFLDLWERWYSHKYLRFAAVAAFKCEQLGLPPIIEPDN